MLALLLVATLGLCAAAEPLSGAVELIVPEEEVALEGADEAPGYAGFVGGAAVSADAGEVKIDSASFPDAAFRDYVKNNFDLDGNGALSENERAVVTHIDVNYMDIADLKGVEWFPGVEELYCNGNRLTRLEVGGFPALYDLQCSDNQLEALDVSQSAALYTLHCANNQLTALDVTGNAALGGLFCSGNQLTTLDLSRNPGLMDLECYDNRLTDLDLSGNTALGYVECYDNRLTRLDLSNRPALTTLHCYRNQLTHLDIRGCPALDYFGANNNLLSEIDLSGCSVLIGYAKDPLEIVDGVARFGYEEWQDDYIFHMAVDETTRLIVEPASLADAKVTVKKPTRTYTGKAIRPAVTVTLNGATLKKGTDYTVSYKNNTKIGRATVTVRGKGNYAGSVKKTFKIIPKKVAGLKLTAGTQQITVKWSKASGGVTGYQVQYGLKKSFAGARKVTVRKAATVTLKRLKARRTYYVRVRSYRTVNGKDYWSNWNDYKKIRMK